MKEFECIVIGGGAAGLSAALVLGRARRRTLVIDSGEQSNRAAEAIEANEMGATSVPGLYVAGDANGRMPSVANAVASGSIAAAAIVGRLTGAIPSA